MQIGVIFPQTEIGGDRGAVREYATAVSEFGYAHIAAYDHVLGADPAVHHGWNRPYDVHTTFHEPMVLFGYLAALTPLELVTSILILPQRQTALVAKQAAEVDLLTGGKFRLGVGLGWNEVEYEALGTEFSNRGKRIEEQVTLLRKLWTVESVSFTGRYHKVTGAGIAPLPSSVPSPCGSAPWPTRPCAARGESPTAGFPRCNPGPSSRRR
ncbi:MAG TPA: TIGR03619 family F420-dependent LLM class oxidoreductase [Solirubrobacteraceae bacterium]|jgi:probable F420-dependent oxidoreductase|nr:TIGR03619 family F420-dependent LLM class oxidoreductase [Solirubrobacteraceae bacterium]